MQKIESVRFNFMLPVELPPTLFILFQMRGTPSPPLDLPDEECETPNSQAI